MKAFVFAALAACLAPTFAAAQSDMHFSDTQYVRAARCAALSASPALKAELADTAWLDKALKDQRGDREDFILLKAREAGRDIERSARKANTEAKIAQLRATRLDECRGFMAPATDTAAAPAASPGG